MIKLVKVADKQVKGAGTNGKEIFLDRRTLKFRYQRRLLPTKRCPLIRNTGRLIEGSVNKEQTYVIFAARKGTKQGIATRSETRKPE